MANKLIAFICIFLILLVSCSQPKPNSAIANPASEKCVADGGKLKIVDTPEGQYGNCVFPDGAVCEEWAYFRGECGKK